MARDFGNTWWGEKWLDSLTHIDYENRIPRGARYARNGSVKKIEFCNDGVVKARVQGSRPSPYKIELKISQFNQTDINKLIDEIAVHPVLMSKLLNRELDPEILPIADKCGLKVFPSSWKDIGMSCSCPDWAVPCKHIAAVIYKISQEIDNNPFTVFSLHGLDLAQAMEKRGIKLGSKQLMAVTKASSLLETSSEKTKKNEQYPIDLSCIKDLTDNIVDLLDESPAFMKDFREKYRAHLKKCQKTFSKRVSLPLDIDLSNEIALSIDNNLDASFILQNRKEKITDILQYLRNLENIDPSLLQPSVEIFFRAYQLAKVLVLHGCIVPQIVETEEQKFRIIWFPAVMDEETSFALDLLSESLDNSIVTTMDGSPLKEGAKMLLSALISEIVHENAPEVSDTINALFFCGNSEAFDRLGEKNIPGSIKAWLSCYFLGETKYKPFIQVTDMGNGFGIEMGFAIEEKDVLLSEILSHKKYDESRYALLQQLSLLLRFIPDSVKYIDDGAKKEIFLTDVLFTDFLQKSISAIKLLSVKVLMPRTLKDLVHPKPTLSIKKKEGKDGKGFIRMDDLIDFDWQVAIGKEIVPAETFGKMVESARGLIRFRKSFFIVDENDIKKISDALMSAKGPGKMRLLQAAISGEFEGAPVAISDEMKELIRELTSVGELPVPDSVKAELRPYQCRGYSWMYKNTRLGFGSIIADDMGLGKTLQVITLLAKMKQEGGLNKALLAVPTGLLANWEAELEKFCPDLTYFRYHGATRNLKDFSSDILLTTYGVLRSDCEKLSSKKWEIMIIDEAQNIKNTDTAQTKAVKSISAKVKIAMSGTPVENRLSEYWSIMDYTNKGYLESLSKFKEKFANPIQDLGDTKCAERFKRITAPFMMRRLKTDKNIINDLPDKITRNFTPSLTPTQAALYQKTVDEFMKELAGQNTEDSQGLFKRQGIVLQMILALKQICDHPDLFIKKGTRDHELSGKCVMLLELIQSIVESGEKVLVFTQFKEMGDILQKFLEKELSAPVLFYHGGCSLAQRTEMVRRFQEVRSNKIFILSLKAAGTGLNLTAASHVIHFDLWWNPAVEQQATDRAYRIGQHKNVLVTRFVTEGTFEERIDKMIESKKALSELTVASGESWIGKLSDKELEELVRL